MTSYKHTQRAPWMLYLMGLLVLVDLVIAFAINEPSVWWIAGLVTVLLALVGLVFSSLTVEVTPDFLGWHFGLGFWKKTLTRTEIAGAEAVKTKWWYGWGIRITPKGWLYNVSGFDAVAVTDREGKTRLIGTDEPNRLVAALQN